MDPKFCLVLIYQPMPELAVVMFVVGANGENINRKDGIIFLARIILWKENE